jgi:hypothetical protein
LAPDRPLGLVTWATLQPFFEVMVLVRSLADTCLAPLPAVDDLTAAYDFS